FGQPGSSVLRSGQYMARLEKRTFYISCTDAEWEQAKRRAADAGMKTSPYLVERALRADLSIFGDRPQPLVLSAEEQSRMSSQLEFLMKIIDPSPEWMEKLGNQVAFLRDAKVTEMIAEARFDELFLAFEKIFGSDRAEALLAKAVKDWHGAKSVAVTVRGPTRRM
ncbi:MAG: hypothetical protein OXC54_00590, partial [Rhodospirillaceae bacterium]|nr:hypothetical protein [Rhodospirillaceae bacterium]